MMSTYRRLLATIAAGAAGVFLLANFAIGAPPPAAGAKVPVPDIPSVPIPPPPQFEAKSWVLMDFATGRILASDQPDLRVAPASITKIMTAYVVGAELAAGKIHWDDQVYITQKAWSKGGASTGSSTSFLKLHAKYPLKLVLEGMLVQSGNDAAIALAQHVAGTTQSFVALMNAYAKRLGMTGTHYSDVNGYPIPDHYSTARDTAILARALIRDFPAVYKINSIGSVTINNIKQYNRNTLLWSDHSVDGIKTGHTEAAGYCLAASAVRDGRRLIAVVMGTPSDKARESDAEALLNYGFRFYSTRHLFKAGQVLARPQLWKGASNHLSIGLTSDLVVAIKHGAYKELKASIDVPSTLIAPYKKGQKVGTLTVTLNGKAIQTRPVVALEAAPEGGFFTRLWDTIMLWFHSDHGQAHTVVQPAAEQ